MRVPFFDLTEQNSRIRGEIDAAIKEVIDSGKFINGPVVEEFEKAIATFCGTRFAVGMSSGTDALLASLMMADISHPCEEVITTPYTFIATAEAISRVGAKPVFVDIDLETYNIDLDQVSAAVTKFTRAVIPVHLFGQMVRGLDAFRAKYAGEFLIIEDAAQAIGAEDHHLHRAGSIGSIGCFSFFPSKNLGGFGDGGMVVTDSEYMALWLKRVRSHGSVGKYLYDRGGGNFRLDTIQAAVLLVKLKYLLLYNCGRRKNAYRYFSLLRDCSEVVLPMMNDGCTCSQFVIRTSKRDELVEFLRGKDISTAVYYPRPLHLQNCFRELGYREGSFPNAERAAKESLALPIYPELMIGSIEYVAQSIRKFFDG